METLLILKNDVKYVPVCKSYITSMLNFTNFSKEIKKKISLVAEEAFCHLVANAYEHNEEGLIKIEINTSSKFQISFFDKGLPFDQSLIEEYDKNKNPLENFNADSLGIFLMKEISDEIKWINLGHKGKELRIIFNYPEKDITETLDKKDLKLYTGTEKKIKSSFYDIHRIKENEYIQVSRCVYKTYGYTYPNEDLYFPEKIKEHNKNGILISIVATDEKNNVVGHYALERYSKGVVAECGQAVIIPEHRGNNLLTKMRIKLEEEARKLELYGIYSQPVATHTLSQKVNIKFDSKPFGFTLGLVPKNTIFKKIKTNLYNQRGSSLLYYKALKKSDKKKYFLPDNYKPIINLIFNNASYEKPDFVTTKKFDNLKGDIEYNFLPNFNFGIIKVTKIGEDSFQLIKQAFYYLTMKAGSEIVYLELPVEEKGCDFLINKSEELGFIFSAVIPSYFNGKDAFRMQFLNCDLDMSLIQIEEDTAKEIFNFILKQLKK
jgi:anti-sigma regulatory factor (Ser/Thr protein kinase)